MQLRGVRSATWDFVGVFHNLSILHPLECGDLLVAPASDNRVTQRARKEAALRPLLGNFCDQFRRAFEPACLLVRQKSRATGDGITAFLNILRIASITRAWERAVAGGAQAINAYLYSDYFDLYPWTPSRNGDLLLIHTPAMSGGDAPTDFRGQSDPSLARVSSAHIDHDETLLRGLLAQHRARWRQTRERNWARRALFRSLEMACCAMRMPYDNLGSINDYGTRLALWVSAFEILAHPGRRSNVDLAKVRELLRSVAYRTARVRSSRYCVRGTPATLPEVAYEAIYCIRNDFLHGNPVRLATLFPRGESRRYPLTAVAPILYKCALAAHLNLYDGVDDDGVPLSEASHSQSNMESALCNAWVGVTRRPHPNDPYRTGRRYRAH